MKEILLTEKEMVFLVLLYFHVITNAKKHKTKTKNDAFSNNMFCAIVMGI